MWYLVKAKIAGWEWEIGYTIFINIVIIWAYPVGIGRVENSKTFQNQMSQCFFIGLYYIETGDNFYFFKQNFLIGGNGFLKNQFLQGKNG